MASGVIYVPEIEDLYRAKTADTASRLIPPLGAEWIRHVVECTYPEHRVRIVVGTDQPVRDLQEIMRPDDRFFGVSCTSLSYRPALPLIAQAEERGVPLFIGGVHARVMTNNILKNHPEAVVVTGPGENVIGDFLNGKPIEDIPGVLRGQLAGKRPVAAPYEIRPFLHETTDYSFFSKWGHAGSEVYRASCEMRVGVRGIIGCTKRKVCSFCSSPRVKPYDAVARGAYLVEERKSIFQRFGDGTYILDCSDSLPTQECLGAMSKRLGGAGARARVRCGAMVWELADDAWRHLARSAGYTDFLIGLEGFARRHLPLAFKPEDSIDKLFDLLDRARDEDIHFMISGIVGWPGECEESLDEARRTIVRLLEHPHVECVSVNCLLPLPGSALYTGLVKLSIFDRDDECPDLRRGFHAHVRAQCPDISVQRLRDFVHELMALDSRVIQVLGFIDEPGEQDGAPRPARRSSDSPAAGRENVRLRLL